jgi:phage terminase small subunit
MSRKGTRANLRSNGRPHKLTAKQATFVRELMVDENATRAATVAGYRHPDVQGCFLQDERKHPLVAEAIREAK